jgi:hypothetical protein
MRIIMRIRATLATSSPIPSEEAAPVSASPSSALPPPEKKYFTEYRGGAPNDFAWTLGHGWAKQPLDVDPDAQRLVAMSQHDSHQLVNVPEGSAFVAALRGLGYEDPPAGAVWPSAFWTGRSSLCAR